MRKRTFGKAAFGCILLVLVLIMLYSGLRVLESTVFYKPDRITMQTKSKTITRNGIKYFPRQDITVVMILGIDWEGKVEPREMNYGGAVDMVSLMIFDKKTQDCTLLNLNRDMMVHMPALNEHGKAEGFYYGQLAYSHTYGTGMEDSCENTRTTISNLLYGLHIDYYFAMHMDAISILNDAVGGVTVNITDDFSAVAPTLTVGSHTLKGKEAVAFVQSRTGVGDELNLSRMERHKEYMSKFAAALKSYLDQEEGFVVRAYEQVSDYIVTDCTVAILSRLAEDFGDYPLADTLSLKGENKQGAEFMEFYADEEALDQLILERFYAPKN